MLHKALSEFLFASVLLLLCATSSSHVNLIFSHLLFLSLYAEFDFIDVTLNNMPIIIAAKRKEEKKESTN
jgi:hypothetical protein